MSDSDDTDFLLFIPPNFFNISSPECFSPVNRSTYIEEDLGVNCWYSTRNPNCPLQNINMDSTSSPILNRINGKQLSSYSRNNEHNDAPLSINALDLSPLKRDGLKSNNSVCNTWPVKRNEFISIAGNNMKQSSGKDDISHTNNKLTGSIQISPGKILHESRSSKFNISQVDQLLMEMEKTREEIKSKLQSNKSKISELRRECSNDNLNQSQDKDSVKSRMEILPSDSVKSLSHIWREKDTNAPVENTIQSHKSQLTYDVNFALPGRSKNMLQLSQIMSPENNAETLQQKLEAEILKKKHCEEMIQELQSKILEQQQNLSVAQKVDAEKEEIIKQLQSAWLQLVEHWKELEQQRQELALILEQERIDARNVNLNFTLKVETLETHLHEAISLASSHQRKNEELEKISKQLQESLVELEDNCKKTGEYAKLIEKEKSNILEQLRQTNENLSAENQKKLLLENRISDLENQTTSLLSEKNDLLTALREEKDEVSNLKSDLAKLREDYGRVLTAESQATQQMSTMKQEILKAKNNLKDFYQNQLDILLRKKIDEFQKEFQKAQSTMRQELLEHERAAEDRMQYEIKQLQDSHKIELSEERRVNQKHVNILKAELKESRKKIYELENRLRMDSSSKAELAKKVQSVLKNQWTEAMNVISGNDDLSKDFLSLNLNTKSAGDTRPLENADESSDLDMISNKSNKVSLDLRSYISMLLDKEPGNPVDEYKNLEFLLSNHQPESSDKKLSEAAKNSENYRKKPPWK